LRDIQSVCGFIASDVDVICVKPLNLADNSVIFTQIRIGVEPSFQFFCFLQEFEGIRLSLFQDIFRRKIRRIFCNLLQNPDFA